MSLLRSRTRAGSRRFLAALAALLLLAGAPRGDIQAQLVFDCPVDVLPELPEGTLSPEEQAFLDEFGAALERFDGMTLEEFRASYSPRKDYLRASGDTFRRGEVNGDGASDLTDAICILGSLFLGQDGCARACLDSQDVDDNGAVEITDPIYLLSYLFLGGPEPAPPFHAPGPDPSADSLACTATSRLGYEPMDAEFLDHILSSYFLSPAQEEAFREHGFVILENVRYDTFFHAFQETWTRDMPIYISVDAILDALYLSLDRMLLAFEDQVLLGELDAMLRAMEGGIDALEAYAPEGIDVGTAVDDVAVWVCVARSLLAGERIPCLRGVDDDVDSMLERVASETLQVDFPFFGVRHCEDFSHFKPRGHYTQTARLARYFRSMMWVQRMGLKFVQFPRHAQLSYLLSRLLYDTGAIEHWERIDAVVEAVVGHSDSANPPAFAAHFESRGLELGALYHPARFERFAHEALRAGLGKQRINSQILMRPLRYPAEEYVPIPPAFQLMGQRFTADSYVFSNVVWDRVRPPDNCRCIFVNCECRTRPSPLDVWFVLGNRATVPLLAGELERWASHGYHRNLAALETLVSSYSLEHWERLAGDGGGGEAPSPVYSRDFWTESAYNTWLSALRELSADTTGTEYPAVMRTETWDRRMLHAQLGSWAQLRNATVLYVKPSKGAGWGCDYPHGWVDPYPQFYDQLGEYAARTAARLDSLRLLDVEVPRTLQGGGAAAEPPPTNSHVGEFLENLEAATRQLAGIARAELAGLDLSEEQSRFIRSLLYPFREYAVEAEFNGWYPRMVLGFDRIEGETFDPSIADVHTEPNRGEVLHVGVGHANLMLISVRNECGNRAYVGPVFSYHEFFLGDPEDPFVRLNDEEWQAALESGAPVPRPVWTREFVR